MTTHALDFETYYDAECSVTTLGTWHYCRHPKFDAYLLSISGDDGFRWIGHPAEAPWGLISGTGHRWVHHNASFDAAVLQYLRERGVIPADAKPEEWRCTADLCAWAGLPRALANAVHSFYGKNPDKTVRDRMKGRLPEQLDEAQRKELCDYAIADADWCLKLWCDLSGGSWLSEGNPWPDWERKLSNHTAEMGWHGVPVDQPAMEAGVRRLKDLVWEAEQDIPWADGTNPPLSPKMLARECAKAKLVPPPSLAMDSPECAAWEDTHGDRFPWVRAMRQYRRCNMLLRRLENMSRRVKDDGRMTYELKYCGCHTRRWSGSASVNLQNLPRKEMFGVDLRSVIRAPEGRTLVVVDLSQVEPRVLAWLADDYKLLDAVRKGHGIYEAFARSIGMWSGEKGTMKRDEPKLYQTSKAMVLGCIAEGELVATQRGLVPIEKLTIDDRVWDGVEWVQHEGVIYRGIQYVLDYQGLTATENHPVYVEGRNGTVPFGQAAKELLWLYDCGSDRGQIRMLRPNGQVPEQEKPQLQTLRGQWDKAQLQVPAGSCKLAYNRRKVRVYDVLDAGPRHRFTVSGKLVHNCGYGASAAKFMVMAPLLTGGAYTPSWEEAESTVARYRRMNRLVLRFWGNLEKAMKSVSGMGDYTAELPSGNLMRYRNVASIEKLGAETLRNGRYARTSMWGSALAENMTQATARDVFAHGLCRVLDHGHKIVLHVHDEVVVECDEADAEGVLADVVECMTISPEWAKTLPLAAEGVITRCYTK